MKNPNPVSNPVPMIPCDPSLATHAKVGEVEFRHTKKHPKEWWSQLTAAITATVLRIAYIEGRDSK